MTSCDDHIAQLGSYALGGLEPDEAAAVERHLQTCAECRQAYSRLASLPVLLDLVEPSQAIELSPPARLEGSVLAGFSAHARARGDESSAPPRRRPQRPFRLARWQAAVAGGLAGAAMTLAVLALASAFPDGEAGGTRVALTSTGTIPVSADARLSSTSAGTEVELQAELPQLDPGEVYELWFVQGDGRVSAGTFTVGADGRADLRLTTGARIGRYERISITREPDATDPARNGPSIAAGALPG